MILVALLLTLLLASLALLAWAASMLFGMWVWPAMGGVACALAVVLVLGWEDVLFHLRVGIRRIATAGRK